MYNLEGSKQPYRNMECKMYSVCLTKAAYVDKKDLGCARCKDMNLGHTISRLNEIQVIKAALDNSVSMQEAAAAMMGIKTYRLAAMRKLEMGPQPIARNTAGAQ